MSKSPVFGQQVQLQFVANNTAFSICEVESFSYKQDDMLKENSSLGEAGVGSLDVLDNGGTVSFETKKRDSRLVGLFASLSKHFRANETLGARGRSPYFQVRRVTKYVDGSTETLTFKKVVLHSPEENVGSNKDEVTEKFEGRYIRREVSYSGIGEASQSVLFGGAFMTNALTAMNIDEGTSPASFA